MLFFSLYLLSKKKKWNSKRYTKEKFPVYNKDIIFNVILCSLWASPFPEHRISTLYIWSHHFMGNRWETVETGSNFIFLGSKITADGDCSHEIQRRLLLQRKVMTNLGSIFKSRDITLPTKVPLVKAMVFPVVMYGCESWTVKKAEH